MAVIQTLKLSKKIQWVSRRKLLLLRSCKRSKTRIGHSDNRTKVSMIGHGVLFTEETLTVAKSMLRCTITSTAYITISKTECALLVHSQNLTYAQMMRGHTPSFLTRKRILGFSTVLSPLRDVFSPLKYSWGVYRRKALRWIFGFVAARSTRNGNTSKLTIFFIETT